METELTFDYNYYNLIVSNIKRYDIKNRLIYKDSTPTNQPKELVIIRDSNNKEYKVDKSEFDSAMKAGKKNPVVIENRVKFLNDEELQEYKISLLPRHLRRKLNKK